MTVYLVVVLLALGLWGLVRHPNLIRKVVALNIVNSSLVILFVYYASLVGNTAPILASSQDQARFVDPLPHALMLTMIVIGVCVTALALTLVVRASQLTGALTLAEMEEQSED